MSFGQNPEKESNAGALLARARLIRLPQNAHSRALVESAVDMLSRLGVDEHGQTTGYLHALGPLTADELQQVESTMPPEVVELYNAVKRMRQLSNLLAPADSGPGDFITGNEENLRKMLIIMVEDARVVMIFLACQLSRLRSMEKQPGESHEYHAGLALHIYAPLANRLGIGRLKWELEDCAFRYLNPSAYRTLARALEEKRQVREQYIIDLSDRITSLLDARKIESRVQGRAKHIYSIFRKMQGKGLQFGQLKDLLAVRILVDSVENCYFALSVIHERWSHYRHEFSDYINMPKANGYQSIHTVISGPDDKVVEVQIRTFAMHEESELGFAAHWRYKETAKYDSHFDQKLIRLRQLLEWKDEVLSSAMLVEPAIDSTTDSGSVKTGSPVSGHKQSSRQVYVFTPKGKIVVLPEGATPIDFAYAIHSEVGHRTRGARVNGKMVALNYLLQTGDQVTIQTVKIGAPSRDWLRPELGYVRTGRARNRINRWYKRAAYDQNVSAGRGMLDRELQRLGLGDLSFEKLNQHTHFQKVDDLLAAIGSNDYKLSKLLYPFRKPEGDDADSIPFKPKTGPGSRAKDRFIVSGVDNLLTHMAKCCAPVPGDDIIGFITASRGVTIHRKGCNNVSAIKDESRSRLIEVEWGDASGSSYIMELDIVASHRSGLLHDITEALKSNRADVLKVGMETDSARITRLRVRLEIGGDVRPGKLIARLGRIRNVFSARRAGHGQSSF